MWSQGWENLESLVRPFPNKTGVDVTDELIAQVLYSTSMLTSNYNNNNYHFTNGHGLLSLVLLFIGIQCNWPVYPVRGVLHINWSDSNDRHVLGEDHDG